MKFSQSLILSVPIARPGEKVPAANARVDVYCEHADRDGAAAAHMRLAEALRPVLAQWLVDESPVVPIGEHEPKYANGTDDVPCGCGLPCSDGKSRCAYTDTYTVSTAGTGTWKAGWTDEKWTKDSLRMADESGIDGDDDEVGDDDER
jgi:hypothetical protein